MFHFVSSFLFLLFFFLFPHCDGYEYLSVVDDFSYNPSLGRELSVIIIIKDFTQLDRARRMIERQKLSKEEFRKKIGSLAPTKLPRGVIVGTSLDVERIVLHKDNDEHDDLEKMKWKRFITNPSGLDIYNNERIVITQGNEFIEIDLISGTSKVFKHDWLRHLHTIYYNHDGTKCLIASSGFDTVIEYDLKKEEISWDWCAWEHGYNRSNQLPDVFLTRDEKVARKMELKFRLEQRMAEKEEKPVKGKRGGMKRRRTKRKNNVLLVDPQKPEFGLNGIATGRRACHINVAMYGYDDDIIGMTFAHTNQAIFVNKTTKEVIRIVDSVEPEGLRFPHSLRRQEYEYPCKGYVIANTQNGSVAFLDKDTFKVCLKITFKGMKSKWLDHVDPLQISKRGTTTTHSDSGGDENKFEWVLINHIHDGYLYGVVDIRRRNLVLLDIVRKEYRVISYESDFSAQDVFFLDPKVSQNLESFLIDEEIDYDDINRNSILQFTEEEKKKILKNGRKIELYDHEMKEFEEICSKLEQQDPKSSSSYSNEEDYHQILEDILGADRPILKSITLGERKDVKVGEFVVLGRYEKPEKKKKKYSFKGKGIMFVESVFENDRHRHSYLLYGKSITFPSKDELSLLDDDEEGKEVVQVDVKEDLKVEIVEEEEEEAKPDQVFHHHHRRRRDMKTIDGFDMFDGHEKIRVIFEEMKEYFVGGKVIACF